jgi:hypothetical protein
MDFTLAAILLFAGGALAVNGAKNFYDYLTKDFDYLIYGIREDDDYFIADAIIDSKETEIVRSKPYDDKNIITKSEFEQEAHAHCEMLVEDLHRSRGQHIKWLKIVGFAVSIMVIWIASALLVANILL